MMQRFLALFAGMITAMAVMMVVHKVSLGMYPMPEGLDVKDPVAMEAYIGTMPKGAFLMVLLAHGLGTLLGCLGASFLAKQQTPRICATIVAAMLVLTVMNLINLPHPTWFAAADVLVVLLMWPLAVWLVGRFGLDQVREAPGA